MGFPYRSSIWTAIMAFGLSFSPSIAAEYYKWVDENGVIHFSDTPLDIPEKYQNQIETNEFKEPGKGSKKPSQQEEKSEAESASSAAPAQEDLRQFEIPYQAYEGTAKRIIIPVTFNNKTTAPMLLDTGAPGMMISITLAEKIGIFDQDEGRLLTLAGGLGGSVPAIMTVMDAVQIGGAVDHFVPTEVSYPISNAFEGIIGLDFMSNYSISINPTKKVVVFQEIPSDSESPGGHHEEWWRVIFRKFALYRNAWKDYRDYVDKKIRESPNPISPAMDNKALRDFADQQYKEADKLLESLDHYASQNAVPRHWREY